MAGTRFWIQSVVLVELFCIVLISVHVGFCRRGTHRHSPNRVTGLSPSKGFPVLPSVVTDDKDGGGFDWLDPLCPLPYLYDWLESLFGKDDDHKDGRLNFSASSTEASCRNDEVNHVNNKYERENATAGTVYLRIMLVLEDPFDVLEWSNKISHEWQGVPSYLERLERVQFVGQKQDPDRQHPRSLIELQVVPPLHLHKPHQQPRPIKPTDIPSIWKHLSERVPSVLLDDGNEMLSSSSSSTSLLVLYVPTNLPTTHRNEEVSERTIEGRLSDDDDAIGAEIGGDDMESVDVDANIPPIWSFGLFQRGQETTRSSNNGNAKNTNCNTWILLPSTKDIEGRLGPLMDSWMMYSIVNTLGDDRGFDNTEVSEDGHKALRTADWTSPLGWQVIHEQWKEQTLRLYQQHSQSLGGDAMSYHPIIQRTLFATNDTQWTDVVTLQESIGEWQDAYEWLVAKRGTTGSSSGYSTNQVTPTGLAPHVPLEHYGAIFLPLLFPLLVPFLIATFKEYKRMKQKRKEKKLGQQDATNAADEPKPDVTDGDTSGRLKDIDNGHVKQA